MHLWGDFGLESDECWIVEGGARVYITHLSQSESVESIGSWHNIKIFTLDIGGRIGGRAVEKTEVDRWWIFGRVGSWKTYLVEEEPSSTRLDECIRCSYRVWSRWFYFYIDIVGSPNNITHCGTDSSTECTINIGIKIGIECYFRAEKHFNIGSCTGSHIGIKVQSYMFSSSHSRVYSTCLVIWAWIYILENIITIDRN